MQRLIKTTLNFMNDSAIVRCEACALAKDEIVDIIFKKERGYYILEIVIDNDYEAENNNSKIIYRFSGDIETIVNEYIKSKLELLVIDR